MGGGGIIEKGIAGYEWFEGGDGKMGKHWLGKSEVNRDVGWSKIIVKNMLRISYYFFKVIRNHAINYVPKNTTIYFTIIYLTLSIYIHT